MSPPPLPSMSPTRSITIRPATTAHDDGLRLLRNFDSQLPWLSAIGSASQWGSSGRSDDEDQRATYRAKVERSEKCWHDPFGRDWMRVYIAEVTSEREDLRESPELLERALASQSTTSLNDGNAEVSVDTVQLPVAGMILQGKSSDYVRSIIPENDDDDPFIFIYYLLSDRLTEPYGKGAGAALISHAKEEARKLGVKRLCVDCWRGNDEKLVRYYEKQGFRLIGNFETEQKEEGRENWLGAVLEMQV